MAHSEHPPLYDFFRERGEKRGYDLGMSVLSRVRREAAEKIKKMSMMGRLRFVREFLIQQFSEESYYYSLMARESLSSGQIERAIMYQTAAAMISERHLTLRAYHLRMDAQVRMMNRLAADLPNKLIAGLTNLGMQIRVHVEGDKS